MSRAKKLALNTIASLAYNLATVICGFILPRFFLTHYGSNVNGLINSISQFLAYISLTDMGVSAVVHSALYKPLANKDNIELSKIMKSASNFYRLIAKILLVYVVLLIFFYPYLVINDFNYFFTASIILVLSINSFAQYYFGITKQILLISDQKAYIPLTVNTSTLIFNTIISIILIKHSYSIQTVKFVSALVYLIQPLIFVLYVKKHYCINHNIELTEEPIKQKWNGMAQHIAAVILNNTDITVLTLFSTLKNVSIYSVYYMVVNGIKRLIMSLTSGIEPMIGNMLAKKENNLLINIFETYEWLMHNITIMLYSITAILITDFVRIYTLAVKDTNYESPIFAILLVIAIALHSLRIPYNVLILAAGHFKETQTSAFYESAINIILSIVLVFKYGLIGVALATIIAMLYRTIYFVLYLSNHIINRNIKYFAKYLITDSILVSIIYLSTYSIPIIETTYSAWATKAILVTIITVTIGLLFNLFFYKKYLINTIHLIKSKHIGH